MKRSRSLSNIPVPHNSRKDSKLTRAKSTLRNSRDQSLEGHTPLAYKLGTPVSFPYRLGAGSSDKKYRTPSNYSGFKRSGSVSSFGLRASFTKSPREKKAMLKLVNDKKWIADQYFKIQMFIQSSGLFRPELSGMIKPPTIGIVVELFSILFGKLIQTDPINSQSYADVAMKTLKLLKYPGTLTLSTLKTANTMHGWPHFISIISWLMERVNLSSINNAFVEHQDEEFKQMFNLQDSVLEFFAEQHSGDPDPELLRQGKQKLYEDMSVITGTDPEAEKNLEQPIQSNRAEVVELETKLQEIYEEIDKLQAQITEKRNVIKQFQESGSTKEQDLEAELLQLIKVRKKQAENRNDLLSAVKELEKIVASQSGRYNEKAQILGQIEDLKRAIGRKERKLAEYRAVKDQLDHELTTMVKEIEAKVDAWNVSITKTLLPEMQDLRLREKGFHSKGFIEEIREVSREQKDITKQLLQEYKTITANIDKVEKEVTSVEKKHKSLIATRDELDSLADSIQCLVEENRRLIANIDEVTNAFTAKLKKIEHSEGSKTKEAENEIAALNDKIQKLTEKVDKTAKKGLGVLVEAHNMAIQNMQMIDANMNAHLEDAIEKNKQSSDDLLKTYNCLLSMQEKMKNFEEDKENVTKN